MGGQTGQDTGQEEAITNWGQAMDDTGQAEATNNLGQAGDDIVQEEATTCIKNEKWSQMLYSVLVF